MTNPTESVESVLAEMLAYAAGDLAATRARVNSWADRLAAAHAREVGELRNEVARREQEALRQQQERLAAHCRAEATEGLLREVSGEVDRIAGGYHQSDEAHDMMLALHELRDRLDAHLSGAKHD